jgi:hypothetical protein
LSKETELLEAIRDELVGLRTDLREQRERDEKDNQKMKEFIEWQQKSASEALDRGRRLELLHAKQTTLS